MSVVQQEGKSIEVEEITLWKKSRLNEFKSSDTTVFAHRYSQRESFVADGRNTKKTHQENKNIFIAQNFRYSGNKYKI